MLFDGGLCLQVNMLSQIDFGESPGSQELGEAIIAQLLPDAISQAAVLSRAIRAIFRVRLG